MAKYKTAMQELIDFISEMQNRPQGLGPHPEVSILDKASVLLEKEREQLIKGHIDGILNGQQKLGYMGTFSQKEAEKWYNENHGSDE